MPAPGPAADSARAASAVRPAAQRERMSAERRPPPPSASAGVATVAAAGAEAGSTAGLSLGGFGAAAGLVEPGMVSGGSDEVSIGEAEDAVRRPDTDSGFLWFGFR